MKKSILWFLALVITLAAAYYQRKTGPTYPRSAEVSVNDSTYNLRFVRSLGIDERSQVHIGIEDTSVRAELYYKRYGTDDKYQVSKFSYKVYPVHSFIMNKIFKITEEKGLFADVPVQPPAGKLQYYIELTDSKGTTTLFKNDPVIIRYKGNVPGYILAPHVLIMFIAMLFSTLAGLMGIFKIKAYKKYSVWTLILLITGGMILGPVVQKYAFGELWTGVPFGWDLTDNKTLIAVIFWILAVVLNRKKDRPLYTALAAIILLLVYSIPHSLFGSQLDYSSGQVTQGLILTICYKFFKES
jgi:hypothetical protein